jgi:uncharacterized membrane protein
VGPFAIEKNEKMKPESYELLLTYVEDDSSAKKTINLTTIDSIPSTIDSIPSINFNYEMNLMVDTKDSRLRLNDFFYSGVTRYDANEMKKLFLEIKNVTNSLKLVIDDNRMYFKEIDSNNNTVDIYHL